MWIEVEPNGLMARVKVVFSRSNKAIEDQRVRDYLHEHRLSPKRVTVEEREGEQFEIWQYGQCYLGLHTDRLYAFEWQGLLSEMLSEAMQDPDDLAPLAQGLSAEERTEVAWKLAGAVIENKAATQDKDDPSKLHFNEDFLREELQRLVTAKVSGA